jgi:FkbM family methyltransferase
MIKQQFAMAGLEFLPKWRAARAPQTAFLSRLFQLYDIDCVIDVGANIGQYRDYLRIHVGYKGPVVSFEPHPDCYEACRRQQSGDPLWHVYPFALGAESGRLDFHLAKDTEFSSFLVPDNTATPEFADTNRVVRTVSAEVRTFDDVFPEIQSLTRCNRPFLKLDTQGFDIQVMKGATAAAKHVQALQTEVSNVPIYKDFPDSESTMRFLRANGWQLACMFPTNPEHFPITVDFDTYFVHATPGAKTDG